MKRRDILLNCFEAHRHGARAVKVEALQNHLQRLVERNFFHFFRYLSCWLNEFQITFITLEPTLIPPSACTLFVNVDPVLFICLGE